MISGTQQALSFVAASGERDRDRALVDSLSDRNP